VARPIIGVTTSSERTDKGVDRAFVNASYIRAVERAGGVPLLLTPYHSPDALARFTTQIDGLLLTGGGVLLGAYLLYARLAYGGIAATTVVFDAFCLIMGMQMLFFAMWMDMEHNKGLR